MLEHDVEYQTDARYECPDCNAVTSHKRTNIKQMENNRGGESSVFVMECRLCENEGLIPAAKFDNGILTTFVVRR